MAVYFITAREVDRVKIGYAFNPVARYRHLQVASPVRLALEGAIAGGFDEEKELHRRYAKFRVHGEWFDLNDAIQDAIEASTRPEGYTWAKVRLWLKKLEAESAAIEAARPTPEALQKLRGELEAEFQERMAKTAQRSRMTELERLEADGVIHFPFRETEAA
jgi:hypothetical protein